MKMNNGVIGWDDEVSEELVENGQNDEFVILPDGIYDFTVAKVERGSFAGSVKVPACNKVDVGIIIDGGSKGRSYVTKMFLMHTSTLGFIYQFLTSIGLHKKGSGAGTIPWGKVTTGMKGRCKIGQRTYKDKVYNEVKSWLEPIEEDEF
jgi:hypothetical protein